MLAPVHARGVVHRDLKPDNLILTPNDGGFPLRVIDWGVARLGPIGRLTLDGLTPGTPIYMSPEQATGRNIGAPCDIYSLGVIAYEALTGHPPFDGRTLAEVVSMHLMSEVAPLRERCGAPRELCSLVHRMLSKEPALRPSAIEIRQLARVVCIELTSAYDSIEIDGLETLAANRHVAIAAAPTEDAVVVDPEALEFGVTELVPTIRRPRWTPEIGYVPVTPRAASDQVSGEIRPKRRH